MEEEVVRGGLWAFAGIVIAAIANGIAKVRGDGNKILDTTVETAKLKTLTDAQDHDQDFTHASQWMARFDAKSEECSRLTERLLILTDRDSAHAQALVHITAKAEDLELRAQTCERDRDQLRTRVVRLEAAWVEYQEQQSQRSKRRGKKKAVDPDG